MNGVPTAVSIVEVGPRDGLQNEPVVVATQDKIALIDALTAAGHRAIEITAFVSPKWVPQMADATDVCAGISRRAGVRYSALVPNRAGLERALVAGIDEVAIFAAASETFSRRNLNQSIDESFKSYRAVCEDALAAGCRVRGYLSVSFGCPFEGAVDPTRVIGLSERLLDLGVYEVAVSDTIGIAHPGQVATLLEQLLSRLPSSQVGLHFHDTRGTALANVLTALQHGITRFDSSAGGLGGCPYAPGATGNLATEDLLYLLDGLRIDSGVSLAGVMQASLAIAAATGHSPPSRYVQALTSSPA